MFLIHFQHWITTGEGRISNCRKKVKHFQSTIYLFKSYDSVKNNINCKNALPCLGQICIRFLEISTNSIWIGFFIRRIGLQTQQRKKF